MKGKLTKKTGGATKKGILKKKVAPRKIKGSKYA